MPAVRRPQRRCLQQIMDYGNNCEANPVCYSSASSTLRCLVAHSWSSCATFYLCHVKRWKHLSKLDVIMHGVQRTSTQCTVEVKFAHALKRKVHSLQDAPLAS
eukprot:6130106-Pleurochrysis_carterae.AAC.5